MKKHVYLDQYALQTQTSKYTISNMQAMISVIHTDDHDLISSFFLPQKKKTHVNTQPVTPKACSIPRNPSINLENSPLIFQLSLTEKGQVALQFNLKMWVSQSRKISQSTNATELISIIILV